MLCYDQKQIAPSSSSMSRLNSTSLYVKLGYRFANVEIFLRDRRTNQNTSTDTVKTNRFFKRKNRNCFDFLKVKSIGGWVTVFTFQTKS